MASTLTSETAGLPRFSPDSLTPLAAQGVLIPAPGTKQSGHFAPADNDAQGDCG